MNIVIIGCGFAGLSSSLLLSKHKENTITIFDKFLEMQAVGAGIMIQPSSMGVLKELDIYDTLIKYGEKVGILKGVNHKKRTVLETKYEDYDTESFGIGIHRSILFDALYQKCLKQDNINICLGKEITSIEDLKTKYDLVIIANGSHSELRKQLPIEQKYSLYPYGCIWTTIEDDNTAKNKLQQYVYYSKHMFGLLPSGFRDNKRILSVFWSLPIKDKDTYNKEAIFKEMEKHHNDPIVLKKIRAANFSFAVYADVWMKKFNHENVVVIGDAAHGMSPQLGQGTNMALIDSYLLSKVLDAKNLNKSLEYFSKQRKSHIRFYTQASKFLTPLFQSDSIIYGLIRDYLFSFTQKLAFSRKMSSHILCGKKVSWFTKKEIKI